MRFRDRPDAGRQLGQRLRHTGLVRPIVLALPRGGVPVAFEVATALDAPLEVFVARKIGVPGHREFGIGAIAEDEGAGVGVVADRRAVEQVRLTREEFDELVATERLELQRRVDEYRGSRRLADLRHRDVVLIDDGVATGVTAEAALCALRARHPSRLVLAAPVCAPDSAQRLRGVADDVVCVIEPARFHAVGQWYDVFGQTTDDEVRRLLERRSQDVLGRPAPRS